MPLFLYHQLKITNHSEFDTDFCYLIVTECKQRKIILNDKPKNQEEDNKGKIKVGKGSKFIFHAQVILFQSRFIYWDNKKSLKHCCHFVTCNVSFWSLRPCTFKRDLMRKPKPLALTIKIYFSLLTDYPWNITLLMVIFESETKTLALVLLRLWGRYFFHVYPGNWVPACVSISRSVTSTITDPESHANSTLVDFFADSFNVTYTV